MATGNRTLLKSNNNSENTGLSQENCYNADQSIKEEEKIEGNINELPDFKMLGRLKVRSKQKKGSIGNRLLYLFKVYVAFILCSIENN